MKLIKLGAAWCAPCKQMDKLLEGIDHPLVKGITKVDVDENPEVSAKYGVRGLPTLIIEDEHGEVRRVQGAKTKQQLLDFLG